MTSGPRAVPMNAVHLRSSTHILHVEWRIRRTTPNSRLYDLDQVRNRQLGSSVSHDRYQLCFLYFLEGIRSQLLNSC